MTAEQGAQSLSYHRACLLYYHRACLLYSWALAQVYYYHRACLLYYHRASLLYSWARGVGSGSRGLAGTSQALRL